MKKIISMILTLCMLATMVGSITVTAATNTTTDISDVDFVIASWGATSTTSSFTFA